MSNDTHTAGAFQLLIVRCERLIAKGAFKAALELLSQVGRTNHNPEVVIYKSWVLIDLKRFDEAESLLVEAIRFNPDNAVLQVFLGHLYLRLGRWNLCWPLMETRAYKQREIMGCGLGNMASVLQQIKNQGRRPRVLCYQNRGGLGDCIQFLRFLNDPCFQNVDLYLQVPDTLRSLVETSFPGTTVEPIRSAVKTNTGDFDVQCPFFSLPAVLGLTEESQLHSDPYVRWEAKHTAAIKSRIRKDNDRLTMGLQWRGSAVVLRQGKASERSLSCTYFNDVLSNLVQSVSLRKETLPAEQQWLCENSILDVVDIMADLAQTAAVIAHLDFVITVDTCIAHLAGAMGKPLYLLLPYSSYQGWLESRTDTPWYPSAHLIRQESPGDWHSCVLKLRTLLRRDWGI